MYAALRVMCLSALLACAACTHQLELRSTPVALDQSARIPAPARYFVDQVHTPLLHQNQLGKKRNFAGQFLAWIKTDSDLAAWAEREWRVFLTRHGADIVAQRIDADYSVTCDILYITIDKTNRLSGNDSFHADLKLAVKIKRRPAGETLYDSTYSTRFNTERPADQETAMPDEYMFNYCLSMVFQKALEKIQLP